jgi:hypothetical protein
VTIAAASLIERAGLPFVIGSGDDYEQAREVTE